MSLFTIPYKRSKFIWITLFSVLVLCFDPAFSQGLEGVIVEEYFVNKNQNVKDIPEGAVTYRIYVDLEPDYKLQTVYGAPYHPFRFETSTFFYNHRHGNLMGDNLVETMLHEMAYLLDSYITIGAASNRHMGILLTEDSDGSVLDSEFFREKDGLREDSITELVYYQLEPDIFSSTNGNIFESENFLIGSYGGVSGAKPENRILIAQLTTDGDLSFEINLQIARPGEEPMQFVARQPIGDGVFYEDLSYGAPK
jgi:hypothetical protein